MFKATKTLSKSYSKELIWETFFLGTIGEIAIKFLKHFCQELSYKLIFLETNKNNKCINYVISQPKPSGGFLKRQSHYFYLPNLAIISEANLVPPISPPKRLLYLRQARRCKLLYYACIAKYTKLIKSIEKNIENNHIENNINITKENLIFHKNKTSGK